MMNFGPRDARYMELERYFIELIFFCSLTQKEGSQEQAELDLMTMILLLRLVSMFTNTVIYILAFKFVVCNSQCYANSKDAIDSGLDFPFIRQNNGCTKEPDQFDRLNFGTVKFLLSGSKLWQKDDKLFNNTATCMIR